MSSPSPCNYNAKLIKHETQPLTKQGSFTSVQMVHTHTTLSLSFLPRPATTFVSAYWKKLTCGVIWSFNCFLVVHQSFLFVPQELKG